MSDSATASRSAAKARSALTRLSDVNRTLALAARAPGLAKTKCPNPLFVCYNSIYVRATLFANRDIEFAVTEQLFQIGGAATVHEANLTMPFEKLSKYFQRVGDRKVAVCNDDGKVSVALGKADPECPSQFAELHDVIRLNAAPHQYLVEAFIDIRATECDFVHGHPAEPGV